MVYHRKRYSGRQCTVATSHLGFAIKDFTSDRAQQMTVGVDSSFTRGQQSHPSGDPAGGDTLQSCIRYSHRIAYRPHRHSNANIHNVNEINWYRRCAYDTCRLYIPVHMHQLLQTLSTSEAKFCLDEKNELEIKPLTGKESNKA